VHLVGHVDVGDAHVLLLQPPRVFQQARGALEGIEKQIAEERGKTDFVKVNEDLRRLAFRLEKA